MVSFKELQVDYAEAAANLAQWEYEQECKKCNSLIQQSMKDVLLPKITEIFQSGKGILAFEEDKLIGYLAFWGPWDGFFGNVKGVFSPLGCNAFGGKDRGKLASILFQKVSELLVKQEVLSYALSHYAHDDEIGKSFVLNGFGIRCSDSIMSLKNRPRIVMNMDFTYCELQGQDKKQIHALHKELIKHMAAAPVFFPSDLSDLEKWYEQKDLRIFIAKDQGRIVGYLAMRNEGETFVSELKPMMNICGAYVDYNYRNGLVMASLLEYLCEICEREGITYLGVDCETLNPTALRFWGKYFENYTYSYNRRIDERIVNFDDYFRQMLK